MSRRDDRDSESKRSYSKIDRERESSPKRSRRDGKQKTERNTSRDLDFNTSHSKDHDQKFRRRLQDALPLEAPIEPESKLRPNDAKSDLNTETDETENDGPKHSSDPTEVPRSNSYFQHDERGSAGQGGRSFGRRATTERKWWNDSKERSNHKPGGNQIDVKHMDKRDERIQAGGDKNNVWHHDRFHEMEADALPPARKRPAFREKKIEQESGYSAEITATDSGRPTRTERPASEIARREERGGRNPYDGDRVDKPFRGDRVPPHRRETQRVGFSSRERFGGGGGASMGRERFNGRYAERNQNNNIRMNKWKHDLFDETNKSPSPKNTDDQIAKVEALLAS
ncbi:cyclin-like protein [Thalictrum thalictroides]|uniref:Cyclin-like protein n=1 Tax=Thalictrum thalictroides TaxID=46969 RepID=A0A7J6W292_THATH|nr:cyclin-like protein [Thalictrum thalictroides]